MFLHAVKKAEILGVVIRFGELVGQRSVSPSPCLRRRNRSPRQTWWRTRWCAINAQRVELELKPFEIKTLLVEL